MATRTRTSFQKRQKELARVEKQRDKAAKRMQRKLEGPKPEEPDDMLAFATDRAAAEARKAEQRKSWTPRRNPNRPPPNPVS